jgi:hypothetical protein
VSFREDVKRLSSSKLGFSDRAVFKAASAVDANVAGDAITGALEISLTGEGAFVYQLQDIVERRVADKQAFFKDLFLTIMSGKLKWPDEYLIIDEVREVGSAAIIVLDSDSGKLTLKGNVPIGPEGEAPLAKAGAKISVNVESGSVFQSIGEGSVTPLYVPRRLVFDPDPPGGNPLSISGLFEWAKERLGAAAVRPSDVRFADYVSNSEMEQVVFEVPAAGSTISLQASHVSIEEFLDLGQEAGSDSGVIAEPEHQVTYVGRTKAAG